MAEGDTILLAAQRLGAALAGETIAIATPNTRGRAAGLARLDGRRLDGVDSHGKNLLLRFGDLILHSHLGMSGSWHVYPRGGRWRKPRGSAWAVLAGETREAVQFGGPTLRLIATGRLGRDPQLARLGPDILAPGFDPDKVVRAMSGDPGRTLGDALLDQSLVAGVGNIFKSEACFAARVDPWQRVGDLDEDDLRDVLAAARGQMQGSVASGRHTPAVYRRRGPCPVCGGRISSRGQGDANRTTYWCPSCQG